MKTVYRICVFAISVFLILLGMQSVVYADSINKSNQLFQFPAISSESDEVFSFDFMVGNELEQSSWYPGFLIVQLLKGIMAFFMILLILFDIIEPDSY